MFGRATRAVRGDNSKLAEEMLLSISGARSPSDFGRATRAVRGDNSKLAEEMLLSVSGASGESLRREDGNEAHQ